MNDSLIIHTIPIAKPRMTQRDKWAKRPAVQKYYAYKDELRYNAMSKRFTLGNNIQLQFHIPLPKSYSNKKKEALKREPHQVKPDIDNLIKSVLDSLKEKDQEIHSIFAQKVWSDNGPMIIIRNIE